MPKTNPNLATPTTTIGTLVVDGRTIAIVSDHATWQAAKHAYTQRAVSRCNLATTRPTEKCEGLAADRVVI